MPNYLYYQLRKGVGFWSVGPTVGANDAGLVVEDAAKHPEFIGGAAGPAGGGNGRRLAAAAAAARAREAERGA
mgnify:CR=1 FL=1